MCLHILPAVHSRRSALGAAMAKGRRDKAQGEAFKR